MKKCIRIIALLLFSLTGMSCQQVKETDYIKKIKSVYDLNYPTDFKVTWAESHSGMGDYNDSFELTFSENNFKKIVVQIDTLKLGRVVNTPGAFFIHQQIKENEFKEVTINLKKRTVVYTHAVL
jgi:hypothetical protein